MNITEHVHAAIISLTQYESANLHGDLDTARDRLLETMGHVVAISKLTPAKPGYRLPSRWENADRLCMYMRCIDSFTAILHIEQVGLFRGEHQNHIALAWIECSRLCEHHGWNLPALEGAAGNGLVRR